MSFGENGRHLISVEAAQEAMDYKACFGRDRAAQLLEVHRATINKRVQRAVLYGLKPRSVHVSNAVDSIAVEYQPENVPEHIRKWRESRKEGRQSATDDDLLKQDFAQELATCSVPPVPSELDKLRDQVTELTYQAKVYKSNILNSDYVKRKIIGLTKDATEVVAPKWLIDPVRGHSLPGVPMTIWSDWHWAAVVKSEDVNGINEFNLEIAHRRVKVLVEKTIYLLRQHVVSPTYPGIVVNLAGDIISGTIHEELENSNEVPIMPCVLDVFGVLKWAITKMADEFGHVFIPCCTGNHGRSTRKFVAKGRNYTSYDWLIYQFLAKHFEGDSRVVFHIPDGPDALYSVAGHRFLLTHGDSFKSGEAVIGHVGAVIRGQKKKLSRNTNIGLGFDTLLHGHFHTYSATPSIIGNGSLIGMDDYAYQGNFGYEAPTQALWLVHAERGITINMPVQVELPVGKNTPERSEWVAWHKP
jgi:hypothetical protein